MLRKFEDDCFEAICLRISLNPVLHSFQQTVNLYQIDLELVRLFLRSMDLNEKTHSFDSYENYILGSAQVVGLMCLQIFTNGDKTYYEDLKLSAMKLGSALQKISFLRDLKADYIVMGRTYFPGIDMNVFTDAEKEAIEADIHQDFLYDYEGITKLPPNASKGVELAYLYYYKLFLNIRKLNAGEILSRRVRISNFHKGLLTICVLSKAYNFTYRCFEQNIVRI
ncbi:phytoene/squalene synthase family protein [Mucilaginibacter conchicola]|uniref:phytoene/squalene synthase family protein n=1 Tax=Mucilaginibacter conchicola TaxID=2303333 RepID=UPI001F1DE26B|nr:squalene/phytoene synthase family protein [Mucilaginibacter conchicola]